MNNSSEITDVIPISDRRTKLTARKHPPAPRFVDYSGPRGIKHIRRDNLRDLVEKHTPAVVAQKVGWKTRSFISQMIGDEPCNPVTESTARRVEMAFGLPHGYMDVDHAVPQTAQVAFGMPNTPRRQSPRPTTTTRPSTPCCWAVWRVFLPTSSNISFRTATILPLWLT